MKQLIKISGMHCEACKARVEKVFASLGIKADADYKTGEVRIESDNGLALEELKNTIEDLGFDFLGEDVE